MSGYTKRSVDYQQQATAAWNNQKDFIQFFIFSSLSIY